MKSNRVVLAITVLNLALFAYQLVHLSRRGGGLSRAEAEGVVPMLRGRGLEIVDDQGRIRAQLQVLPADTKTSMPDGTKGYPESVILRMSTPDGKPRIKLTTSVTGSSLMLLGDSDTTQSILHANGAKSWLKLRNDEKTEQILKP
jgi:hypothetical protein